jgi:hypothetical protein
MKPIVITKRDVAEASNSQLEETAEYAAWLDVFASKFDNAKAARLKLKAFCTEMQRREVARKPLIEFRAGQTRNQVPA